MTKNELWINMLTKLGIYVSDELRSGELLSRKVLDDNVTCRIFVKFEKALPCKSVLNLLNNLTETMKEKLGFKTIRLSITYDDEYLSEDDTEEYLKDAIRIWSNIRKDIVILNSYDHTIDEGVIEYLVPTQNEGEIIRPFFADITKYFVNYGLNNVSLNYHVDEKLVATDHRHEMELVVQENQEIAKSNEKYMRNLQNAAQNEVQGTSYFNKKNNTIKVSISELPSTKMELNEFEQLNGTDRVTFTCVVVKTDKRSGTTKTGKPYNLFTAAVTDFKDSINIKRFYDEKDKDFYEKDVVKNKRLEISGRIEWDDYNNTTSVMAFNILLMGEDHSREMFDGSTEKRVELHAHTKMSVLDSVLDVEEYVAQAARYGHKACAVTDHENCHIFPDFYKACDKKKIKPIFGLEANYVNKKNMKIALTDEDIDLTNATYVIYDLETTGLCQNFNEIIEIGAVKVQGSMIVDTFSTFVKPLAKISNFVSELTSITNDMVYDAPNIETVLPEFKNFIEGSILVGHNVKFDNGFIYKEMKRLGIYEHNYPTIDTIMISRFYYSKQGLKRFNLGATAKFLKAEIEQQHRAIHDAKTTYNVFMKMLSDIWNEGITNYKDLNKLVGPDAYRYMIPTHLTLLVKNQVGLKNFYKILSDSQTTHFNRSAIVVDEVLEKYHEGVLIGSGCVNGEVFRDAYEKSLADLEEDMQKYDYIEVQPPTCYKFLYEKTNDPGAHEYLLDTIKLIIDTAKRLGKIVVATGDVHELLKEDCEYRKILINEPRPNGMGVHELHGVEDEMDMHFRTTSEMLDEFSFLDSDLAYEIVVTNTNKINEQIESFPLFKKDLFVPADDFRKDQGVPSMKQAIYDLCNETSHKIYGEVLPKYVEDRMNRELEAIISHGYFSVYYISHLLVKNSNDHGYIVGSRGSVGSSFVAFLMNITDVNALVPHYVCPNCHFSAFKYNDADKDKYNNDGVPLDILEKLSKVKNGLDLEECECPKCHTLMTRTGNNIEFETFLGFTGEKVPDIDLNFSGEYQADAHKFVQEVFGKDYSFRAGTVSTVADKTAYAMAKDYYDNVKQIPKRSIELDRIAGFLEGSKKTTGQHPGGIVVVPNYMDIYDVTPIQYPPVTAKDDLDNMPWRTSHFEYHSFEANLLKLDILGHDDPTMMKHLLDYVKNNPDDFPFDSFETIPLIDKDVLSLFSSKDALNIEDDDLNPLHSGTIGVPEFGTDFVRGMLETIRPDNYNDLIKVSGLAHGTDVWHGNAESLVLHENKDFPEITFDEVIGCRDDIMTYLRHMNMQASIAFKIMEAVRKGRGLSPEQEQAMHDANVPEWFFWTCHKIKYLFPKAHAAAYVMNALRIAWFKVHRPIYYYAVYFSIRAKELDAEVFALGKNAVKNKIQDIRKKKQTKEATNKEDSLCDELLIALEMILRGYKFNQIDLEYSDATEFVISSDKKSLYLPFSSVANLGEAVALSIVEQRRIRPFSSKKDFERRTAINKTQFAKLMQLGVFDNLPDDDPASIF